MNWIQHSIIKICLNWRAHFCYFHIFSYLYHSFLLYWHFQSHRSPARWRGRSWTLEVRGHPTKGQPPALWPGCLLNAFILICYWNILRHWHTHKHKQNIRQWAMRLSLTHVCALTYTNWHTNTQSHHHVYRHSRAFRTHLNTSPHWDIWNGLLLRQEHCVSTPLHAHSVPALLAF